jgi:Tfp pilus assembly protein PilF
LLRAGKADEAEQAAREGLTRFAEAGELWGNLGESLLRQDKAEAARSALDEGLKRQPQHPELWATRAETELKMGQPSAALADLEHAVSLPRPSSRAEFNLGVLLEPTSPARAAQHFRRYLELAPGAPDAAAVQARIERDEGS